MFLAHHGLASEAALHGGDPFEDEDDDEYEDDCGASHILDQLHEAEVHMQLLVTVEQS